MSKLQINKVLILNEPTTFLKDDRPTLILVANSRNELMEYCAYAERPEFDEKGRPQGVLVRMRDEDFVPAERRTHDFEDYTFFEHEVAYLKNGRPEPHCFFYALPKAKDTGFDETAYHKNITFKGTKKMPAEDLGEYDTYERWTIYDRIWSAIQRAKPMTPPKGDDVN